MGTAIRDVVRITTLEHGRTTLEQAVEAIRLQVEEVERVLAELQDAISALARRLPGDHEGVDAEPAKGQKGR